ELGLYEVDPNKSIEISKFDFNFNLIMQGNIALSKQLDEVSQNGEVFHKLLHRNKQYFIKSSGFINREVRYARAVYCVKKLSLNIIEKYHAEIKTKEGCCKLYNCWCLDKK
ncbi:hypothetical protein Mgra_00006372, partial [Meloidogyne graminicola]